MDGIGDRAIPELEGKTPLEAANSPNLDKLAKEGITGLYYSIKPGVIPGSDTAHLSIFGLNPYKHYHGRGPMEAMAVQDLVLSPGDIAFRANVGTVDENMMIKDRRAGRIESTDEFCRALDGIVIDDVRVFMRPGTWYRASLVLRGSGLSDKVSPSDPHVPDQKVMQVKPLDKSLEAKRTADVLNKFTEIAYKKLKDLEINKKREQEGKLPGNMILFRGPGRYVPVPTFKERFGIKAACIAGGGLYRGIARLAGMDIIDVEGATGRYDSDFKAKTKKAMEITKDYDLVFIHMKATDSAGEDGNFQLKKEMVEKMDEAFGELLDFEGLIIVTGDHTTPCELKAHSYEPTPVLMRGHGIRVDEVDEFSEKACTKGGLHVLVGMDLMSIASSHMRVRKMFGA